MDRKLNDDIFLLSTGSISIGLFLVTLFVFKPSARGAKGMAGMNMGQIGIAFQIFGLLALILGWFLGNE